MELPTEDLLVRKIDEVSHDLVHVLYLHLFVFHELSLGNSADSLFVLRL